MLPCISMALMIFFQAEFLIILNQLLTGKKLKDNKKLGVIHME